MWKAIDIFVYYLLIVKVQFLVEGLEIKGSVSCDEKIIIVNTHNDMRQQIAEGKVPGQPKSSDMQKMVWDDKLEKLAQNWANKIKKEHNKDRHDDRFSVGENLHFSYDSRPGVVANWTSAITDWFIEHELYTYSTNFDVKWGHYTQVVWANTIYVGCGYTHYNQGGITYKTYVCNYGPTGNYIAEYPYQVGEGCEQLCCTTQCNQLYGDKCSKHNKTGTGHTAPASKHPLHSNKPNSHVLNSNSPHQIIPTLISNTLDSNTSTKAGIEGSVSCDEKLIIVNMHNELRQNIAEGKVPGQPKSSNMQKLAWDDKLEILAQNWANKAKKEQNQDKHDDRFYVGENLYFFQSSRPGVEANWTSVIDNWFIQHESYNYSTDFDPQAGLYTQIVWADTIYIGCGYSYYIQDGVTYKTYVCNYGPTGNFLGEYPYQVGAGCEQLCCTTQCDHLYGNKCAEHFNSEKSQAIQLLPNSSNLNINASGIIADFLSNMLDLNILGNVITNDANKTSSNVTNV